MTPLSSRLPAGTSQPTMAAIVESIAAVAISFGLAIHFETIVHIAVGACVAPLLLMRSAESEALGKRWFSRIKVGSSDSAGGTARTLIKFLSASIAIRVLATARYPVRGIRSLPNNWYRVILCTDVVTPLEFVPGSGTIRNVLSGSWYSKTNMFGYSDKEVPDIFQLLLESAVSFVIILIIIFLTYKLVPLPDFSEIPIALWPLSQKMFWALLFLCIMFSLFIWVIWQLLALR
jgi:hypothetical protein